MIPSLWPNAPEISENKSSITINPGINNIDYPTAQILLDSGKVVLLDVRERDEYNLGYIIGAINFPVDAITKDSAQKIIPDKNIPIILYCLSGKRAYDAALKLRSLGYNYLLNMGGISHWPYGTVRP